MSPELAQAYERLHAAVAERLGSLAADEFLEIRQAAAEIVVLRWEMQNPDVPAFVAGM